MAWRFVVLKQHPGPLAEHGEAEGIVDCDVVVKNRRILIERLEVAGRLVRAAAG
jgi:hypothetical protein